MAAVVDRRFQQTTTTNMVSAPGPGGVLVADQYGGWMTRKARTLVFGLLGFAIVLGLFLPGVIMIGMEWNNGIWDTCSQQLISRAFTTQLFFIFHAFLVIPMFIHGDRAQAVVNNNNGFASFWRNRVAHTAAVLQVVGNIIELALLAWTAAWFWDSNDSDRGTRNFNGASCSQRFPEFTNYMWAMLIGGMAVSALSILTIKAQYTSAALRDSATGYANPNFAKGPAVLAAAP